MSTGAYVREGDEPLILVYGRVNPQQLRRALPLSATDGFTHLVAMFARHGDAWRDYVGPATHATVAATVRDLAMVHVDDVGEASGDLAWMVAFAREQLSWLPDPLADASADADLPPPPTTDAELPTGTG
jgi:hypothetical protein